jgi:DNA-binding NarL/FixJ family response regulator
MTYQILIVEDHPLLRQGLRALVGSIPDCLVVEEAASGHDAIEKTLALLPDIVMIDLSLPDMGALDVVVHVMRRLPGQKFIALSDSRTNIEAGEALCAGCQGYLLKSTPIEEVTLAIRTVARGCRFVCPDVANDFLCSYMTGARAPEWGAWNLLTGRERAVFRLIAQGKTNRKIGAYMTLSQKTIEKHRATMMRKLNLHSAVELVLLAVELGLIDRPDISSALRLRATGEPEVTPVMPANQLPTPA